MLALALDKTSASVARSASDKVPLPACTLLGFMSCISSVTEFSVFSSVFRLDLATSRLAAYCAFSDFDWLLLLACAPASGSSPGVHLRSPLPVDHGIAN